TYRAGSWRARRSSAANSSVDLPIPGSPPSSTKEPGTTPPPSTRSSSLISVQRRISEEVTTSESRTGRESALALAEPPCDSGRTISSTSEFQFPQSGHLPSHLAAWKPQDWQTKRVRGFATSFGLWVSSDPTFAGPDALLRAVSRSLRSETVDQSPGSDSSVTLIDPAAQKLDGRFGVVVETGGHPAALAQAIAGGF